MKPVSSNLKITAYWFHLSIASLHAQKLHRFIDCFQHSLFVNLENWLTHNIYYLTLQKAFKSKLNFPESTNMQNTRLIDLIFLEI